MILKSLNSVVQYQGSFLFKKLTEPWMLLDDGKSVNIQEYSKISQEADSITESHLGRPCRWITANFSYETPR